MPSYTIEHPTTGQKITLTGDGIPTDADIREAFASVAKSHTIQGKPDASAAETKAARDKWIADQGTIGTRIKQGAKDAVTAVMPYVRPVVEGLGAGAGGIAGGVLGAGAGGIGAIPGGVAGAALGYGGAKARWILSINPSAMRLWKPRDSCFQPRPETLRQAQRWKWVGR